ncbi:NADH-quinone oxidoreductase subunit NuoN [Thiohalophilus sp.]|uniref:NADH-quinone oxidoreductase subunit NuoN n=1 Tax=Thiohalophilus sp. TaxID=3028392 RepID=UPI003A0FFA9A
MTFTMPNIAPALPEIFILSMACLILVIDLFLTDRQRFVTYLLTQATLVVAFILIVTDFSQGRVLTFSDTFVRDPMADVLKACIFIAGLVTFTYSRDYLQTRQIFKGEFFVLGLFAILGMMILTSAHNFLTIYLGLELLSLSLYAMVAMQRDSVTASEAAMKYFVLGAIASGMLLYGISMIYGVTGTLDLAEVARQIPDTEKQLLLTFGLVFLIVGVAFKLGAVPFHMWVPDVYHGAATPTTLFIGSAPKIAAFAMLMRLLVDGLGGLHAQWQDILIILAVLSMGVGNIVAIAQSNIKRMLAYSTISHVGFLMLGVLTGTAEGYAAAMFYTLAYVLMTLGGFGMIILLSREGFEADKLDDFKGLNQRSPWFAFMMLIVMFSMAGVPPFIGFWAKLSVLKEVIAADMVWLAVVAVLFSIIGAFYYLRVIRLMYFDKPVDTARLEVALDMRLLLSANGLGVLLLGLFPGGLLALCLAALSGS